MVPVNNQRSDQNFDFAFGNFRCCGYIWGYFIHVYSSQVDPYLVLRLDGKQFNTSAQVDTDEASGQYVSPPPTAPPIYYPPEIFQYPDHFTSNGNSCVFRVCFFTFCKRNSSHHPYKTDSRQTRAFLS